MTMERDKTSEQAYFDGSLTKWVVLLMDRVVETTEAKAEEKAEKRLALYREALKKDSHPMPGGGEVCANRQTCSDCKHWGKPFVGKAKCPILYKEEKMSAHTIGNDTDCYETSSDFGCVHFEPSLGESKA